MLRDEMQTTAEAGHEGEPRWTHTDHNFYETISSGCAIVGFFVGYQPCGGQAGQITKSRHGQVEVGLDWTLIPGKCRKDDVEARNARLPEFRAEKAAKKAAEKAAAASSSGQAASLSGQAASSSGPIPKTPTSPDWNDDPDI